jgi:hypothetical protein
MGYLGGYHCFADKRDRDFWYPLRPVGSARARAGFVATTIAKALGIGRASVYRVLEADSI